MTTPNFGFRKPSGGSAFDPDGDIGRLADDVDAGLQAELSALPLVQSGQSHTGSTGMITVTFPEAFVGSPAVVAQLQFDSGTITLATDQVTSTGFRIRSYTTGSSTLRTNVPFAWVAVRGA